MKSKQTANSPLQTKATTGVGKSPTQTQQTPASASSNGQTVKPSSQSANKTPPASGLTGSRLSQSGDGKKQTANGQTMQRLAAVAMFNSGFKWLHANGLLYISEEQILAQTTLYTISLSSAVGWRFAPETGLQLADKDAE